MIPYGCISTGNDVGMIEVVLNAETVSNIQQVLFFFFYIVSKNHSNVFFLKKRLMEDQLQLLEIHLFKNGFVLNIKMVNFNFYILTPSFLFLKKKKTL